MNTLPRFSTKANIEERQHLERVACARRVGMFTERMTVTPEFARLILEKFAPAGTNRRLRHMYASVIARDIAQGRWNANTHQGLAFREDGILQDGQHRLAACAESGVAITLPVTYGQPNDVFEVVDQGTPRTTADLIQRAGLDIPSSTNAAAVARLVICLRGKDFAATSRSMSRAVVYEFVGDNRDSINHAVRVGMNTATGLKSKTSPSMLGAAFYLIIEAGAPEAVAHEFFDRLKDGVGLTKRSPILVLREATKAGAVYGRYTNSGERARASVAAIISAWNLWRAGKPCQSLNSILYSRETGVPTVTP